MAKMITTKSQIPLSARKAIKNFSSLTDNQAIFEYELNKLKRRARSISKEAAKILNNIIRPRTVYKKDIQTLRNLRGKELKSVVEASTATEYADEYELAIEIFDKLIEQVEAERDAAIVSYSSYRSGRTRSAKSRVWITDNITRGADKLLQLIETVRATPEDEVSFYRSLDQTKLSMLQDAVSEYMAGLYYQTEASLNSYMMSSKIYQILSSGPVSMGDLEEFDEE